VETTDVREKTGFVFKGEIHYNKLIQGGTRRVEIERCLVTGRRLLTKPTDR
jgi:hypothetical protein